MDHIRSGTYPQDHVIRPFTDFADKHEQSSCRVHVCDQKCRAEFNLPVHPTVGYHVSLWITPAVSLSRSCICIRCVDKGRPRYSATPTIPCRSLIQAECGANRLSGLATGVSPSFAPHMQATAVAGNREDHSRNPEIVASTV